MKLQLDSILQTPTISDYEVLTGEHTLKKFVSGITIMDTYDIGKWINPDELLIVGKFFLEGIVTKEFLLNLHKNKCSGIITKKKFKQYINNDLLIYARNLGFPIIIFSDQFSWNDIMSPINLEIVRSQNRELQLADQYNYIMINSVFKNNSFKGICDQVTKVLKFPIALVNKDFKIIDSSHNLNWNAAINVLNTEEKSKIYLSEEFNSTVVSTYHLAPKEYDEAELLSYTLDKPSSLISKLLIFVPVDHNIRNVSFHLKIENFLHILSIKEEMYKQSLNDFLWHEEILINEILNYSQQSEQHKNDTEFATGKTIKEEYYIVVINNKQLLEEDSSLYHYAKNEKSTKPYFKHLLLFRKKNQFIGFLPANDITLKTQIQEIYHSMKQFYNNPNFLIGVSSLKNISDLKRGVREAEEALGNTSLENPIITYSSLGFLRLLTDKNGKYENEYYYELLDTFINPLVKLDSNKDSDLLITIITYFENNQAIQSTANQLFIHKNTLRSRLKHIFSILEINSSNSDHLLNLQIAIKIYQSIQNIK